MSRENEDLLLEIEEKYEGVKELMASGKEKGYLLYDEVNDLLPVGPVVVISYLCTHNPPILLSFSS